MSNLNNNRKIEFQPTKSRRLKDKLDYRKYAIRNWTLEVEKEKDEKEDLKKKFKKLSSAETKLQNFRILNNFWKINTGNNPKTAKWDKKSCK